MSPSQMLMGRRLRTQIPMTKEMLKPQLYDPEEVLTKLKERQRKQKLQHDQTAKELPPLRNGELVRVRECNKLKPDTVTEILPSPRSYKVETERREYRRNRHLLRMEELKASEFTCTAPSGEDLTDTEVEMSGAGALQSPRSTPVKMSMATTTPSGKTVREPLRFKDYVKF